MTSCSATRVWITCSTSAGDCFVSIDNLLGSGRDMLVGGLGNDTFVFTSLTENATADVRDVIRDFLIGADKIDVSALGFTSLGSSFTGEAGELALVVGTNTNLLGDIDGDRVADFRLLFTGAVALTLDDIVL